MDLKYSEEHKLFREEVRQFLAAHKDEAPTGRQRGKSNEADRK
ncbi:MAG: hypothetical protein QGI68_12525 [Pseudomonadales bacterium]|jgi:hypothetical protein|nr:hypothetical protein [Pseudomonadales bacterium]MDP7359397.1 hypothetical protein [Pseudomonadales bacterium]MDP7596377.1 hypothetical protein [Pseudomonadales bacterium]HJN48941.1 hypothetical protein [Pseudomonadales bacterium]|tara:strand:- start:446 stop:574 length:129 start_codon:yes stop_codon:yes gene_type:complete